MKQTVSQKVIGFIVKYVWMICVALILAELGSTLVNAGILVQETAHGVAEAAAGEVSGRVDGVLRLLTGLSHDDRFADTSEPLYDRAALARPYRDSYDLFMIALLDEQVNVASTNTKPGAKLSNLAQRDYLQQMYATGEYQITDAFPAGADGVTMNYTIAVPILEDGVTVGGMFGAIYFDDIEAILERNSDGADRRLYLLGGENTVMTSEDALYGKTLTEHAEGVRYWGTTAEALDRAWRGGEPKDYWQWGSEGLLYVTGIPVPPTDWTIVYQVRFFSVLLSLLPIMLVKLAFYILLCVGISVFGRRYLRRQLAEVSHLWDKLAAMQREIFQTEQTNCDAVLDLTVQGLTDQLTGLATRTVFLNKMQQYLNVEKARCALFFLDLDDLKHINDSFGHETGDCALVHFAKILKEYEQRYKGVAARYGGDEFVLLLGETETGRARTIAESLCAALRATLSVKQDQVSVSGSVGVSLYPQHGDTAEELICKADLALYIVKENGKNGYALYDDAISAARLP